MMWMFSFIAHMMWMFCVLHDVDVLCITHMMWIFSLLHTTCCPFYNTVYECSSFYTNDVDVLYFSQMMWMSCIFHK